MPKFDVSRNILVKSPRAEVFAHIRNFKTWPGWSPWLITEPDCALNYEGSDAYSWEGVTVGSGRMEIVATGENGASIDYRLTFLKPWKSVADVRMILAEEGDRTRVTWSMNSSIPFFMFWKKSTIVAMIGMDYERGLRMLKDQLETGSVPTHLAFEESVGFDGCRYVGIHRECSIKEMGSNQERDLAKVQSWVDDHRDDPTGLPFSIYHQWKLAAGRVTYTLGIPMANVTVVPNDLVTGAIPACDCYVVRHTGPFRHVGNAWAAGMMRAQSGIFKSSRSAKPFEVYEKLPKGPNCADAITAVYLPRR